MSARVRTFELAGRVLLLAGICVVGAPAVRADPPTSAPELRAPEIVQYARISKWKPVFEGIELLEAQTKRPRPLQVRAARIDLKAPGIRFIVTPPNGDAPGEVSGRTSKQFLTEFGCQLAINTSFFRGKFRKGAPQDVVGLAISRGERYSKPEKFAALLIRKDNKVWIDSKPWNGKLDEAYNAAAGDTFLLKAGRIPKDSMAKNSHAPFRQHPRSAAGITQDGRYLILITIDGRQEGYSEGATKVETAEWLRKLGAWDALNFDGGGSTNLVIQGPDGQPKLVNHPYSNWLRPCASHLGVYARPLEARGRDNRQPSTSTP